MAQACHSCRLETAVSHCVTESLNFCFTCDYLRHSNNLHEGHIRYQICDNCKRNPALLLCCDDEKALCQSCYSRYFKCTTLHHRIQILNRFPPHYHHNNIITNQHHEHAHMPHVVQNSHHEHEHVVGHQRRAGMLETSCNGNNNCERWMFAMRCESCLASDAVVYCRGHDKLLCHNCDRVFHLHEAVPPHLRCILCGNCKRPSRNFLIGAAGYQFTFPSTIHLPAAEEVSASPSTQLNQLDNDFFGDNYSQDIDCDFSWFGG